MLFTTLTDLKRKKKVDQLTNTKKVFDKIKHPFIIFKNIYFSENKK